MALPDLQSLAYPGVCTLVAFLAFSSQYLFLYIDPGPLQKGNVLLFNTLVAVLLICYTRTCFKDPGRIPRDWHEKFESNTDKKSINLRYCRRCDLPKPPRAHHCKTCQRCIVKMDHHCVWTANCISNITFPHFLRFLFYAVSAMCYLEYFLYVRCVMLWNKRNLPSYLGPNVYQLIHLFVLVVANSLLLFALVLLLGRTVWGLAINVTTIEGWEIERHHALLRRARVLGGYLDGPDGSKVRIEKQEFPWDVGIWTNIRYAMGTWNPLAWFWPFAGSPSLESGLEFEHNEIEDPSKPWPPPDPDRMFRAPRVPLSGSGFTQPMDVESFRKRQAADMERYIDGELVLRRRPFHERYQHLVSEEQEQDEDFENIAITEEPTPMVEKDIQHVNANDGEGEEAWRTKEGERLADFGLDETVEFYDEDDLPLSEILRRKRVAQGSHQL